MRVRLIAEARRWPLTPGVSASDPPGGPIEWVWDRFCKTHPPESGSPAPTVPSGFTRGAEADPGTVFPCGVSDSAAGWTDVTFSPLLEGTVFWQQTLSAAAGSPLRPQRPVNNRN